MESQIRNYYAVKVTGGQEVNVALMIEERVRDNNINEIFSIIVPPNMKGYVIVEATGSHIVKFIISGLRHARGVAPGLVTREDLEKMISKKAVAPVIKVGDFVEVISGPFRGMQGKVVRVEEAKGEVVLNILESNFPIPVTMSLDQVRPVKKV